MTPSSHMTSLNSSSHLSSSKFIMKTKDMRHFVRIWDFIHPVALLNLSKPSLAGYLDALFWTTWLRRTGMCHSNRLSNDIIAPEMTFRPWGLRCVMINSKPLVLDIANSGPLCLSAQSHSVDALGAEDWSCDPFNAVSDRFDSCPSI